MIREDAQGFREQICLFCRSLEKGDEAMILIKERIGKLIETIGELIYEKKIPVHEYRMKKTDGREPDLKKLDISDWQILTDRQIWGGHRE